MGLQGKAALQGTQDSHQPDKTDQLAKAHIQGSTTMLQTHTHHALHFACVPQGRQKTPTDGNTEQTEVWLY